MMPIPQPINQSQQSNSFQQIVLERLESMDKRLSKLDTIEKQLSSLSVKMTSLDNRILALETSSKETNDRLTQVENSRMFDSQANDELRSKQTEIDNQLKNEQSRINNLKSECDKLKRVNEDIIDLQSRSMRDNLLFFGHTECSSVEERRHEDCTKTILDFCKDTLKIEDAATRFKIERAHRVGVYDNTKTRPIVIKFSHYPDKMFVKQKASEVLKGRKDFRVSDQFPKAIQDRRKILGDVMMKAREDGKDAYISYDKLFINRRMYTVENVASAGYS